MKAELSDLQGSGPLPSLSRLSGSEEAGHIDRLQSVVGQLRSVHPPPAPPAPPQSQTGLEGNLFSKLSRRSAGGGSGGPAGENSI